MECLVLAGHAAVSVKLCGISLLERSLRTLQACGFTRALILTDSEELISEAPRILSPHWTKIACTFSVRPAGPITLEQLAAVWPENCRGPFGFGGDSVFDPRLLRLLGAQDAPAALVDSAVPAKFHPLVLSAPMTKRGRFCGAALLSRDWVSGRNGPLEERHLRSFGRWKSCLVRCSDAALVFPRAASRSARLLVSLSDSRAQETRRKA